MPHVSQIVTSSKDCKLHARGYRPQPCNHLRTCLNFATVRGSIEIKAHACFQDWGHSDHIPRQHFNWITPVFTSQQQNPHTFFKAITTTRLFKPDWQACHRNHSYPLSQFSHLSNNVTHSRQVCNISFTKTDHIWDNQVGQFLSTLMRLSTDS